MEIKYGSGKTEYGPGVSIELTADDVAAAVDAWLVSQGIYIGGPRIVTLNGAFSCDGKIDVDPSGFVCFGDALYSGRGPKATVRSES